MQQKEDKNPNKLVCWRSLDSGVAWHICSVSEMHTKLTVVTDDGDAEEKTHQSDNFLYKLLIFTFITILFMFLLHHDHHHHQL